MSDFRYSRSYRGRIKAIILDWAGTTVDYGCCAPAIVFIEVFKRMGVAITMEQAREPMGTYKKDHIRQISQMPAVAAKWREVHGRPCGEEDVEAMFRDFVPLQLECLSRHSALIPGALDAVNAFRKRGWKIGSTTGYTREMMAILEAEAARQGYRPDAMVCASDVPAGRPAPWMCFENAKRLGVYPMEAIVKIGDTVPDIAEALNAGMWVIGLAKTGNEVGLTEAEVNALPPDERHMRLEKARERLWQGGAHYVVDSLAEAMPCLDDIEGRLARGERP